MISAVSFSGISNKNYVNNKKQTIKQTVPLKENVQPEKSLTKSNKKLKTAVYTGLALAAGIAVGILSRGKRIATQKANILKEIPQDLQIRFEKLKDLSGEDFVKNAYKEMVDYMGLKGVAPKEISINGNDGLMSITGGYSPIHNTIKYSSGFVTLSKNQQLNMLSHELKHCEQFTNMLRTEGITVDKYVETSVNNSINNAIKNPLNNIPFHIGYRQAKDAGKTDEFIANVKEQCTQSLVQKVRQNFSDVLKMPKFKADSPEGKKAFEHLKANSEYEGLDIFGMGSDTYRNNPLEVEAYAFGNKMGELLEKYLSV